MSRMTVAETIAEAIRSASSTVVYDGGLLRLEPDRFTVSIGAEHAPEDVWRDWQVSGEFVHTVDGSPARVRAMSVGVRLLSRGAEVDVVVYGPPAYA